MEEVQELFKKLNDNHREQFKTLAIKGETEKLREFINSHLIAYDVIERLNVKELRIVAAQVGIKDYLLTPKLILLGKIKDRLIRSGKK